MNDGQQVKFYLQQQTHDPIPESVALLMRKPLNAEDAFVRWNEMVSNYEVQHLEFELREFREKISTHMDEAALQRLVELQEALEKAKTVRTFAPAETDNA